MSTLGLSFIPGVPPDPTPPGPATSKGASPYLRLMSQVGNGSQIRTYAQLTGAASDARTEELLGWFHHFHGETSNTLPLGSANKGTATTTAAAKLSAAGAVVSNYRNGSATSQAPDSNGINFSEAAYMEQTYPLAISTFWPGDWDPNSPSDGGGLLNAALNSTQTTVTVTQPGSKPVPPAPELPMADTWPYINSRGTGLNAQPNYSKDTVDFVSWIRIGDEIMQVVSDPTVSAGVISFTVRRGIWGTTATSHSSGVKVLSPVYVGNYNVIDADRTFWGCPGRVQDPEKPLRYTIKVWDPDAQQFLVDRIVASFGPDLQGHNAVWLDLTSCIAYSHGDAWANRVATWYISGATERKLTNNDLGGGQVLKAAYLRAASELPPGTLFYANNAGALNTCTEDNIITVYDGASHEDFLKPGVSGGQLVSKPSNYESMLARVMEAYALDWPIVCWIRWDYNPNNLSTTVRNQYRRFAVGSILLCYRPTGPSVEVGGSWELTKPDEYLFWQWGDPIAPPAPTVSTDVAWPGHAGLLGRRFQYGTILVNPTTAPIVVTLTAPHYDVTNDANPAPRVSSVTVPALDAKFLVAEA